MHINSICKISVFFTSVFSKFHVRKVTLILGKLICRFKYVSNAYKTSAKVRFK